MAKNKKRQHGGAHEEKTSWFSGLFGNNSDHEKDEHHSKSSGILSGLFGSSEHSHASSEHSTTGENSHASGEHSATGDHSHSSGLTFQKIVTYIAAIILAGALTVIGFMIYNSKRTIKYPPEVSECPDYWESTGPGKCRNTLKVGTCPDADEMDFNDPKYRGPTGIVEKCKWANSCGLVWDGLKC